MILLLTIWILNTITASSERLAEIIPKIENLEQLEFLQNLGIYSYFDTLGKSAKSGFYVALAVEVLIEFTLFLRYFPQYLANKFKQIRNRSIHEVEILKAIKYKVENNIELSKKELKFWTKKQKKGGNYEKI
ncbi:hypothetical protein SGZLLDDJ_CDS_0017 [Mycoplasmopsis phage vB_Mfe_PMF329]|uniref:hypothetical protein n=1 Tax=Mycoplasmopsis felis TaxID=33923 RepID=UPI002AFF8C05|nr:hypothetical protein [Mycoplasmopsis felis]WQQ04709.1 hypothetical protein RRG55_03970 [Mycoplasmopsis felis]WVD73536.1 hypothetical protein SGZLLDDJ_CDS_0017 [Mycoplasmopsis phage vB_Mfe_PMF329]